MNMVDHSKESGDAKNSGASNHVPLRSVSADEVRAKGNPGTNNTEHFRYPTSNTREYARNAWVEGQNSEHLQRHSIPPKSLDETFANSPNMSNNERPKRNSNPSQFPQRQYGHRRVHSGDSATGTSHPPIYRQHHPGYADHRTSHMSHSISTSNIAANQPYTYQQYTSDLSSPNNRMHHSMSVDMAHTTSRTHEHLCKQSTSFVKLQTAIAEANNNFARLEQEVQQKEKELHVSLGASENPTEKDYLQLKQENEYLQSELQEMTRELDKWGIPFPGDPSAQPTSPMIHMMARPLFHSGPIVTTQPSPINPIDNTLSKPLFPNQTRQPIPHTQGAYTAVQPPPPYERIVDPSPPYEEAIPTQTIQPRPPLPPPPLPPRPIGRTSSRTESVGGGEIDLENEHWSCPKCTFNNLLVLECEQCCTPRPVTLNRHH